jgi:hypothetical protein
LAKPTFVDIDGDGDLDAFVGEQDGTVKFYRNSDPSLVAGADVLSVPAGGSNTTTDVTANDQFKVEVPAQFIQITAFDANTANGGMVLNNANKTFTYTITGGFVGVDSFTYTLSDGVGNTAVGTVTVNVTSTSTSTADPATTQAASTAGGGGGVLTPWSLLLLPLATYLRRRRNNRGI